MRKWKQALAGAAAIAVLAGMALPIKAASLSDMVDHALIFVFIAPPVNPPVGTFIGATSLTSNTTAYTFTNHAIGTASSDRLVVVVACTNVVAAAAYGTCTIGGVNLDHHVTASSASEQAMTGIFSKVVTSGTTATIVINVADAGGHCSIAVYTITGWTSTIPVDTDTHAVTTVNPLTKTLTGLTVGDIVICGFDNYTSEATLTWAGGVTEDWEETYGEGGSSGGAMGVATGTSMSPTCTRSVTAGESVLALAAWH